MAMELKFFQKTIYLFHTFVKTPCSIMNTPSSKNDQLKIILQSIQMMIKICKLANKS